MNHRTLLRQARAGLIAAAFLATGGIAAAIDPAAAGASAAQGRIEALIGDAGCDEQGQCRTVGIGAKPCGGPESWLAWSTRSTDARALQDAVQAQVQARKAENQRSGLASDCMVRPEPTAVCRPRAGDGKKTCQLGQGGVDSAI
ncbi:MAG: hypothetical protein ACJ8GJ_09150 [Vitreoscilla sp.]